MNENYKILGKYIKDMSSETPDVETYLFVKDHIAKYQLNIDINSKVVAEFYKVSKAFEENQATLRILAGFSIRIKRGDRIGIIGKNGSGKTTFLKLLLKEILPDRGTVKVQKTMEFSYFDQNRSDLKPNDTLKDVMVPNGGDYLEVNGKMRHVYG